MQFLYNHIYLYTYSTYSQDVRCCFKWVLQGVFMENIFLRTFHIFPWISHFNIISFPLLLCFCSSWILKSGPKHHDAAMPSVLQSYLCTPTHEKEHLFPNLHGVFFGQTSLFASTCEPTRTSMGFSTMQLRRLLRNQSIQIQSLTIRTPQF